MWKKALTVVIVLLILLAAALFALRLIVTTERVEAWATRMLGPPWSVSMEGISVSPLARTVRITGFGLEEADEDTLRRITADRVELRGIGIRALLSGRIALRELHIDRFEAGPVRLPPPNGRGADRTHELPVSIRQFELSNGTFRFYTPDGRGRLEGLNLRAGEFNPSESGTENGSAAIALLPADIEMSADSLLYDFFELRYRLHLDHIGLSEGDGTLSAAQGTLRIRFPEEEFRAGLPYRMDQFDVALQGLNLAHIDWESFRRADGFRAGSLGLDEIELHITLDKRLPCNPDPGYVPMPTERLAGLPTHLQIDTTNIAHADIRYSEIDEEGARPGTIRFAQTQLAVGAINSQQPETIRLQATSLLEEEGEMWTEIRFAEQNGEHRMEVTGSLVRFDLTRLNNILPDLEGLRVDDGRVHRLAFDYTLTGEGAAGVFQAHYEGFSVSLLDRESHEQGLEDQIAGFLLDQIAVRGSAGDEQQPAVGEIEQARDPERGVMHYLWAALRSGINDVIRKI